MCALGSMVWGLSSVLLSPCHLAALPLVGGHVASRYHGLLHVILFSLGYFMAITAIGILCALLGRQTDILGHFWTVPVGIILFFLGMRMLRHSENSWLERCLQRITLPLYYAALLLGSIYGILSSACMLSFLIPLLMVFREHTLLFNSEMVVFFALGHSIPFIMIGMGASYIRRFLPNEHSLWGHRIHRAGGCILLIISIIFILHPFLE